MVSNGFCLSGGTLDRGDERVHWGAMSALMELNKCRKKSTIVAGTSFVLRF